MVKPPFSQWAMSPGGNLDGLLQERHNSIANALELRFSCTNPSIYTLVAYGPCQDTATHLKMQCSYKQTQEVSDKLVCRSHKVKSIACHVIIM